MMQSERDADLHAFVEKCDAGQVVHVVHVWVLQRWLAQAERISRAVRSQIRSCAGMTNNEAPAFFAEALLRSAWSTQTLLHA